MQVIEHPFTGNDSRAAHSSDVDITQLIKEQLIGVSRWVRENRAAVALHASHDNPMLIEGEAGAGKEFLARLIHKCSTRCHGPFIAMSCDRVSEESAEAALFGSVRHLPSGRHRIQSGLVEAAAGGTLYIDGAATLSVMFMAKLTHLIQHQKFRRVGNSAPEAINVRIIFGSAPSPQGERQARAVEETFIPAQDRVSIPPLRQRRSDIEPLARHFIKEHCAQIGKEERDISPEIIDQFRQHDWPGNVGELKRVTTHMVRHSEPPCLTPSLLPSYMVNAPMLNPLTVSSSGVNLSEEVKQFEVSLVCAALKQCQGVQVRAAQLLGLKLTTLNAKISRYGIDVAAFK